MGITSRMAGRNTGESQALPTIIRIPYRAATHGYLPDRDGYRTFLWLQARIFQAGARVEKMSLVDEGPTLAEILGLDLGRVDGR